MFCKLCSQMHIKLLFILCFHETTNNYVKKCINNKIKERKTCSCGLSVTLTEWRLKLLKREEWTLLAVWNFFSVSPSPQQVYSLHETEPVMWLSNSIPNIICNIESFMTYYRKTWYLPGTCREKNGVKLSSMEVTIIWYDRCCLINLVAQR